VFCIIEKINAKGNCSVNGGYLVWFISFYNSYQDEVPTYGGSTIIVWGTFSPWLEEPPSL
jgi:hypothetical protein